MDTTEILVQALTDFCADKGLKPMSADELLHEVLHTREQAEETMREAQGHFSDVCGQVDWLKDFIERWDATQKAEDASHEGFAAWQATRIWCHDFAVAGYEHAADMFTEERGPISGYGYCDGAWIEDQGEGKYWVIADRGDIIGTLDQCEQFLWDHHSKFEFARSGEPQSV